MSITKRVKLRRESVSITERVKLRREGERQCVCQLQRELS